jgi:hypothetical protein
VALQLADELGAAGSQAGNDGVDVLDGVSDTRAPQDEPHRADGTPDLGFDEGDAGND